MRCRHCGSDLPVGAMFCGDCGRSVNAPAPAARVAPVVSGGAGGGPAGAAAADDEAAAAPERAAAPDPVALAVPTPEALSSAIAPEAPGDDVEATRVMAPRIPTPPPPLAERYVLQFSTGESVAVTGSGLVGRNPKSEPGEYVEHLVSVFDVGKSVSKTHLEFGQDAGRFWVSDRFSTNGSVVRPLDGEPRRCEPGRRYTVGRGTRVDLGEQFFVVS